jgi:hypothetical protein
VRHVCIRLPVRGVNTGLLWAPVGSCVSTRSMGKPSAISPAESTSISFHHVSHLATAFYLYAYNVYPLGF